MEGITNNDRKPNLIFNEPHDVCRVGWLVHEAQKAGKTCTSQSLPELLVSSW